MSDRLIPSWDFSPLAASDTDPALAESLTANQAAVQAFCQKWQADTSFSVSVDSLKQALDEYEALQRDFGFNSRQSYYLSLRSQQDQQDTTVKALSRTADEAAIKLYNQIQFFVLAVAAISPDKQAAFLAAPELADYSYFLSQLFAEHKYLLSEKEESILALVSQPASSAWVDMTETFLSKEQGVVTVDGQAQTKMLPELLSLLSSQDKAVRDEAAGHVHAIVAKQAAVATEEMNALLHYKKIVDELRGFDRPDTARHIGDGVSDQFVDGLVSAVSQRYDIAHRFYQLKAQLLGQPYLAYHERSVEYGQIKGNYDYPSAMALVSKVFDRLDPEFAAIANRLASAGQLDVFPAPGKSGGAFCAHGLVTQPTYVLLNHTDRLQDVLTIAHELGHAINNELSRGQNALNFGTSLATAEVASTFMEDFVLKELLTEADRSTQLALMMMKLNDDISTIFRQVACYQFEQELHSHYRQSGYMSTQTIGQIFHKHMAAYMGPSVEQSAGSEHWWVYWSHIRNSFYVYSYASGLLISKSLQAKVQADSTFISQVKQFLAAGTSDSPTAIFADIGLDIEQPDFWQAGLDEISQLLDQTEELAADLGVLTTNK